MKPDRGWLYFIGAEQSDLTKIGFSTNPRARLSQVQTGNAERLQILYVVPATKCDEAWLHDMFGSIRQVGEWFKGSSFVRLAGEQIMALHMARIARRMGLETIPIEGPEVDEFVRRVRSNKICRRDMTDAVDLALGACGA